MTKLNSEISAIINLSHQTLENHGVPEVRQDGSFISLPERIAMVMNKVKEMAEMLDKQASTLDLLRDVVEFNGFDLKEELDEALLRRQAEEKAAAKIQPAPEAQPA